MKSSLAGFGQQRSLDRCDILPGVLSFTQIRINCEHPLEVPESGVELGNAAGPDCFPHVGQTERVMGVRIAGVVGERFLAVPDSRVEVAQITFRIAESEV